MRDSSRKNWKNWRVLWPLARLVPSSLWSLSKGRTFLLKELPKNSVGAEIGVWKGNFSKKILQMVNPTKLYLIDPWICEQEDTFNQSIYGKKTTQTNLDNIYQQVVNKFSQEINNDQVKIFRGYSHEVCNNFEDNYFDWIYIDGNHQYEFIKKDLELYYPKIKMGGFITGDDYYGKGMWWQDGVKRAVDEFIATKRVKLIKIKNGQFLLKKVSSII